MKSSPFPAQQFTLLMLLCAALLLLQCCPECKWYFRDVLFYATGGAALLGAACLLSLGPVQVGRRWRDRAGAGAGAGAWLQARLCWLLPAALPDTETEPLLTADRGHANYT